MIILANTDKKKNVVFINGSFLNLPLMHKHVSLQTLLHPTPALTTLIGDPEQFYQLAELNLVIFKLLSPYATVSFDLDALADKDKLVLSERLVNRPLQMDILAWVTTATEFYVKSSPDDVIVCISGGDTALSHGFVKLDATTIKEVPLELFYSQFTYFDIHNTSQPNTVVSDYEVTVAKAFELGLN